MTPGESHHSNPVSIVRAFLPIFKFLFIHFWFNIKVIYLKRLDQAIHKRWMGKNSIWFLI